MDAVYLAILAVCAALTAGLYEFCDLLLKGDRP